MALNSVDTSQTSNLSTEFWGALPRSCRPRLLGDSSICRLNDVRHVNTACGRAFLPWRSRTLAAHPICSRPRQAARRRGARARSCVPLRPHTIGNRDPNVYLRSAPFAELNDNKEQVEDKSLPPADYF